VSRTSFDNLKPVLERSWTLLGIPDRVITARPATHRHEESTSRKRGLSSTLAHQSTPGPMV